MTELTIWTREFWQASAERAIRTAAQAALLQIGADVVEAIQLNVLNVDWSLLAGFAGGGAVLSLLMSIAGNAKTRSGPSFTDAEQVVPPLPQPEEPDKPDYIPERALNDE